MLLRGTAVLVLAAISSALLQSEEDKIVTQCQEESREFADSEDKFIDTRKPPPGTPNLPGPQIPPLQERVYEIEKRQRPFECIAKRSDGRSRLKLETSLKYRALVRKCKSKQEHPRCNRSHRYRRIDGNCNNLLFPRWGSVLNCMKRLFPPNYNDGVSSFRQSKCGKPLPDARFVSLHVHHERNRTNRHITHMVPFFGQLVAHDLSDISLTFIGDKQIDCCSHPHRAQHPQCAPILLKKDDFFYSQFNVTCFDFVRAALCGSCSIDTRNQMNQATSFIDLSFMYGLVDDIAKHLRANDGTGKMKVQHKSVGDLLPADPDVVITDCGGMREKGEFCFDGGDRRTNMHTPLMSLQTLFLREHNRIAGALHDLNPDWDDETLYQESRRIGIAQMQVIIYKELLPVFVGPTLMTRHDLRIRDKGRTLYDSSVDSTLLIEFNTAAYRLHTLINDVVTGFEIDDGERLFRNLSVNVGPLYHGKMDELVGGVTQFPCQKYDRHVAMDLTEYLYKEVKGSYGFDLPAVNIQRGRDTGLPTYTEVVKFLSNGKTDIRSFDDLQTFMEKDDIELLKSVYCNVTDIDLWVGLNNELVQENMVVGPHAGDIIARQFKALKYGDRFYFEHVGNFDDPQRQSLKEASLSKVMCDNTDISDMQQNAMLFPSSSNLVQKCQNIPGVDLSLWKQKRKITTKLPLLYKIL